MDEPTLDSIQRDIEELRKAINKNQPLLREIADSRIFAILALPMGVLISAFFIASHFLVAAYGSFETVPLAWKVVSVLCSALFFIGGGVGKWILISRRAAEIETGATTMSVLRSMYGKPLFHANMPAVLCMVAIPIFAVWTGHPWYAVSAAGLFLGFAANGFAALVRGPEYVVMGWFALLSSLASLFFIEGAPFLWTAVIWGGSFILYGAIGLLETHREPRAGGGAISEKGGAPSALGGG
ncbi:MAG: hypothetical protein Q8M76_13650 [Spirochaetaceae bacterium]|nr:hypothetical protein [Spirochaetaceae bacterium]